MFRNLARFFDERQKIVDTPGLDVCDWEKCEFGLSKIPRLVGKEIIERLLIGLEII